MLALPPVLCLCRLDAAKPHWPNVIKKHPRSHKATGVSINPFGDSALHRSGQMADRQIAISGDDVGQPRQQGQAKPTHQVRVPSSDHSPGMFHCYHCPGC